MNEALRPARGVVYGLLFAIPLWILVIGIAMLFWRLVG